MEIGEPSNPRTAAPRDWIGFRLVDRRGIPIAHARYCLKLPDGFVMEGILDKDGRAYVRNIPPGGCELSLPDMDADEWQVSG